MNGHKAISSFCGRGGKLEIETLPLKIKKVVDL